MPDSGLFVAKPCPDSTYGSTTFPFRTQHVCTATSAQMPDFQTNEATDRHFVRAESPKDSQRP